MEFESKSQVVRAVKVSVIIALLITAFWAGLITASPSFTPPNLYLDSLPSTASYVISTDGTYYWATRYDGKVAWSGTNASYVINNALSKGKVFLNSGKYGLTAPILIQTNGTTLEGEGGFADTFFTSDASYKGYATKASVLLYDASDNGIDLIKIGFKERVYGASNLTFGVTIKDLMISGYLDPPTSDSVHKLGSGIACQNVQNLMLENLAIFRKTYGIKILTSGSWFSDNVNDVVILSRISLAYNTFGIYNEGWLANLRINSLFGYLNEQGLLKLNQLTYDAHISHVWSNGDSAGSSNIRNASIYLGVKANVYLNYISIQNTNGTISGVTGLFIEFGDVRGKVFVNDITIQGVNGDAIRIDGNDGCEVYLNHIYVGQAGSEAVAGGPGSIAGSIVTNYNGKIKVYVNGGFVNCSQSIFNYFVNVTKVSNLSNYLTGFGADVSSASYVVFADGANYFMKNGTTGQIDAYGTNASQIINWAIGNLTSGGRVFVKAGSYNVSTNVVVGSNVEVVGEGKGSTLFLGVNQSNQQLFYGLNIENVTLRSLHLSGKNTNNTNEFGVYFINSSNIKIQECSFENFWGTSSYSVYYVGCNFSCVDGCYFEGGQNSAVTLTDCRWSEIIRCKSYNCPVSVLGSAAFVIFGTSSLGSYQCSIVDCVADLSQEHGFQIYQYSYNCSVVGGTVSNCVDTGVCLGNPAVVNTCVGIKCVGVTVSACGSGIILYNKEAVVSGCVVNNCTGNGIYLHDVNVNGSVVSGCFVMRTNNGIAVEGCWNVILGNSIFDVANNAGIYILGDNNTITGNVVRNCNDGIILDTGADFNVVLGCCVFNSSPTIGDYGVGNVKEHNIS